jgi:manganese transport protein
VPEPRRCGPGFAALALETLPMELPDPVPETAAPSSPVDQYTPPPSSGNAPSLEDVHGTVPVNYARLSRRLFAFFGPAYLVSVGYMDPGNWATDLEGGARFGHELLWVLLLSNLIAVLLQTLAARLGVVSGQDLAQACRDGYPRPVAFALWILAEIAIAATDLAEIIGTAISLYLLFGLDPLYGVLLTFLDTLIFLGIQRLGVRKMEAFILTLVGTIGICFLIEIILAQPAWGEVVGGLLPPLFSEAPFLFSSGEALYVAIGILGATVMPHNLYLHSALVQTRRIEPTPEGRRRACRYNLLDGIVALNIAFLVNASILILAATTFHPSAEVRALEEISLADAPELLQRLLGSRVAPVAFAIALLAAGQSSTITGTLAGQVVMEGFVHLRLRPWVRRLLTRVVAILPALLTVLLLRQGQSAEAGEKAGLSGMTRLLVLSQVILSLQLPFAVVPLLQFTGQRARMGEFANPRWVRVLGWLAASIIIALNALLVVIQIDRWTEDGGAQALFVQWTVIPIAVACGLFLVWLIASPWLLSPRPLPEVQAEARATADAVAAHVTEPIYRRIGVALDNSPQDVMPLRHAAALARGHGAELVLIHVVEGVGGQYHGQEAADSERLADQAYLEHLARTLREKGLRVRAVLGFGLPAQELARTAAEEGLDLLVLGSHGHGAIGDRLFGETSGPVRHAVSIPVLTVREPPASRQGEGERGVGH